MERFLVFIALLFSWTCLAATPGNAPILTIAAPGQQTQALSIPLSSLSGTGVNGVFSLYTGGSFSSTDYYPFYKNGVAYATGATTKAYCVNATASSATAPAQFQYVSSQTSFAFGASSIVSGTYQCGSSTGYACMQGGPTGNLPAPVPGAYVFGDGVHVTYAGIQASASYAYSIHLDCYEQ